MKKNTENFLKLVSDEKSETLKRALERKKNRARLRESQNIALKVLNKLDLLGWSQVELSKKMKVSKQQVNKIVSGKENLTLETQVKLQEILDIPILASYFENDFKKVNEYVVSIEDSQEITMATENTGFYQYSKPLDIKPRNKRVTKSTYKSYEHISS